MSGGSLVSTLGSDVSLSSALAVTGMIALALLAAGWVRYCGRMGRYVVNESLEGGVGKGSGVWSNAVFDCCGPPGGLNVCCYTCFCPCFAAAEVARAGGRNYWASWCCAMLPCCGGACTLAVDRDQLGQRFEVPEPRTYCQSWCCMLWCQACHLAQMLNHYKRVVNSTIVGEDKRAAPLPRGTVVTQLLEARQVAGPAPHTATPAASASTAAKASKTHPTHTLQQTTDKTATRTRTQGSAGTALAVTQNQTSQFFVKPPAPQVGKAGGAVEAAPPPPPAVTQEVLADLGILARHWYNGKGLVLAAWVPRANGGAGELERAGQAAPGCILLEINGADVLREDFSQVSATIKAASRPLALTFLRPLARRARGGLVLWPDDVDPDYGISKDCLPLWCTRAVLFVLSCGLSALSGGGGGGRGVAAASVAPMPPPPPPAPTLSAPAAAGQPKQDV